MTTTNETTVLLAIEAELLARREAVSAAHDENPEAYKQWRRELAAVRLLLRRVR